MHLVLPAWAIVVRVWIFKGAIEGSSPSNSFGTARQSKCCQTDTKVQHLLMGTAHFAMHAALTFVQDWRMMPDFVVLAVSGQTASGFSQKPEVVEGSRGLVRQHLFLQTSKLFLCKHSIVPKLCLRFYCILGCGSSIST